MGMIPARGASEASAQLYRKVGGFFTNTRRGSGHCAVCTGPAAAELCPRCTEQRREHGTRLADLVVPLAYAKGHVNPFTNPPTTSSGTSRACSRRWRTAGTFNS